MGAIKEFKDLLVSSKLKSLLGPLGPTNKGEWRRMRPSTKHYKHNLTWTEELGKLRVDLLEDKEEVFLSMTAKIKSVNRINVTEDKWKVEEFGQEWSVLSVASTNITQMSAN